MHSRSGYLLLENACGFDCLMPSDKVSKHGQLTSTHKTLGGPTAREKKECEGVPRTPSKGLSPLETIHGEVSSHPLCMSECLVGKGFVFNAAIGVLC